MLSKGNLIFSIIALSVILKFLILYILGVEAFPDSVWYINTAEEIYNKLSNFGHHNEFDDSGLTVENIQECIDNRIVNYNHKADQSEDNKYNANYKLQVLEDHNLPSYLIKNKEKFKDWFD